MVARILDSENMANDAFRLVLQFRAKSSGARFPCPIGQDPDGIVGRTIAPCTEQSRYGAAIGRCAVRVIGGLRPFSSSIRPGEKGVVHELGHDTPMWCIDHHIFWCMLHHFQAPGHKTVDVLGLACEMQSRFA